MESSAGAGAAHGANVRVFYPKPQVFECPAGCGYMVGVRNPRVVAPIHTCRLSGLAVTMVPEGTRAGVTYRERDDYEGGDVAQRHADGRVVMAADIETDDALSAVVYAPTARARLEL